MNRQDNHARQGRLVDHNIVERAPDDGFAIGTLNRHLQPLPLLHLDIAVQGCMNQGEESIHRMFCQEAQRAQIDAEDRSVADITPGHRKQRAVSSQHDNQIRAGGKIRSGHLTGEVEGLRAFSIQHGLDPETLQFDQQLAPQFDCLCARTFENNSDAFRPLHPTPPFTIDALHLPRGLHSTGKVERFDGFSIPGLRERASAPPLGAFSVGARPV